MAVYNELEIIFTKVGFLQKKKTVAKIVKLSNEPNNESEPSWLEP